MLDSQEQEGMSVAIIDRDILFSNEAFVTGMLQAVSGGSLIAALAQSEPLIKLSGKITFLIFTKNNVNKYLVSHSLKSFLV